ncbi:MAG TPA: Spy/CpxP family protein refolding chaperone [Edaphobacter sp.]
MKMTIFRKAGMQAAILAVCTSALLTMPMRAQDTTPPAPPQGQMGRGRGGPGMGGNQVEFLTSKLNLTPDQVTQVKAIDADSMKQASAVRDDTSLAQADRRTKMMDIRKASTDKIRAILTDDQKTKYDALQAEMQEKMKERRQGGGPPPAPPQ